MSNDDALSEWVCDRFSPRFGWRWVIDSLMMSFFESTLAELWYQCSIFNIKYQLIIVTNFTNLSYLSFITEMLSKPESEENSFKGMEIGKKLGKRGWTFWERKFRIEIAEFDEVVREIET